MRKFALFLSVLLYSFQFTALAQDADTSWKSKYETSLGLSQTTFTNWAAGGENSSSVNAMLNIYKDYVKGHVTWNNYLGLAYGLNINQTAPKMRKNSDKINFVTKVGLYAWKKWDYSGLFSFNSQFDKGYNYPNDSVHISKFMAPGYFQLSIGMNYKPVNYFSVFISPIGARLTVVNDKSLTSRIEGAYGIFGNHTTLWQIGCSVNAVFKKDIMKNVNLMSKLDLFSDYRHNPQNIVVGWENNILMKVNKYISMNLATMLIYDDNIPYMDSENRSHGARTQFRETFSIGLAYTITHN